MLDDIQKISELIENNFGSHSIIKMRLGTNSAKVLYYVPYKEEYIVHTVNLHKGCEGLHYGSYCKNLEEAEKIYREKIL